MLEALSLWAECFQKLLRQAGKANANTGLRRGEYRLGEPNANYFAHDDIHSVRSGAYGDIVYDMGEDHGDVLLEATVSPPKHLGERATSLTIGFARCASFSSTPRRSRRVLNPDCSPRARRDARRRLKTCGNMRP